MNDELTNDRELLAKIVLRRHKDLAAAFYDKPNDREAWQNRHHILSDVKAREKIVSYVWGNNTRG